jgi:hypothetical protein
MCVRFSLDFYIRPPWLSGVTGTSGKLVGFGVKLMWYHLYHFSFFTHNEGTALSTSTRQTQTRTHRHIGSESDFFLTWVLVHYDSVHLEIFSLFCLSFLYFGFFFFSLAVLLVARCLQSARGCGLGMLDLLSARPGEERGNEKRRQKEESEFGGLCVFHACEIPLYELAFSFPLPLRFWSAPAQLEPSLFWSLEET